MSMDMKSPRSPREALEREYRLSRTPVSAQERDDLVGKRAKPVHETHLTPEGSVVEVVKRELDADNERRIGFINKRLSTVEGKARDAFRRSR